MWGGSSRLRWWRLLKAARIRTGSRGVTAPGAYWEQTGSVLLPKLNIGHHLGPVKKLAGVFSSSFVEGAPAIVTSGAMISLGNRSQVFDRIQRENRSYRLFRWS